MFHIQRHQEPRLGQSRTVRYEGRHLGGPVSFFLIDNEPGQGSALHLHPYSETWIVRKGEVEFTVGAEKTRAFAGDVVVAAANIPHRFENVGSGRLELVCIHPSETIVQELVQPDLALQSPEGKPQCPR
ncbi:cupin domain-containing protein [Rhizobium sp. BK251]|uniref:cupin domain-containing protein n=1 Tax=Rhizobium sp. BK251 TaxID=2512125 RepID=UPI001052F639|nr:cupin domain-containing protein [Rhizobium sp. BK251]TCL72898.1 cupin domain [Rhizobium sp. BK251]